MQNSTNSVNDGTNASPSTPKEESPVTLQEDENTPALTWEERRYLKSLRIFSYLCFFVTCVDVPLAVITFSSLRAIVIAGFVATFSLLLGVAFYCASMTPEEIKKAEKEEAMIKERRRLAAERKKLKK